MKGRRCPTCRGVTTKNDLLPDLLLCDSCGDFVDPKIDVALDASEVREEIRREIAAADIRIEEQRVRIQELTALEGTL